MSAMIRPHNTAAFLLALLVGMLLAQGASAEPRVVGYSKKSAEQLATDKMHRCQDLGGEATVDYDMNSDGSIDSVTVNCHGGIESPPYCTFYQGVYTTTVVCELVPGATEPSRHTPIGGGALEDVEATTAPVHGEPGGGTLDSPEGEPARPVVTGGTVSATLQGGAEDDEER